MLQEALASSSSCRESVRNKAIGRHGCTLASWLKHESKSGRRAPCTPSSVVRRRGIIQDLRLPEASAHSSLPAGSCVATSSSPAAPGSAAGTPGTSLLLGDDGRSSMHWSSSARMQPADHTSTE
eukprot:scaffold7326_cov249-Pinguiococcus_pyrenoidosus.AAC.9